MAEEEEDTMLDQREDETGIASEDPADAAVNLSKKKRLCRHPVS